ncbi:hypothetical protein OJF2_12010 [Aquisphaera giovannonii]|uniref:Uncharacterized protein n=1 Tax=Aquisphaera giovannonii TaxID=406548 RepID=A0A5B9VWT7_9BACT|nr:hypothetical protein OJF2_12010 [Aquisphaera giovannonii]
MFAASSGPPRKWSHRGSFMSSRNAGLTAFRDRQKASR